MPSKTPTLVAQKKMSQPFLNSDQSDSLHARMQAGGYATSKNNETRSRTAFQSRLDSGEPDNQYSALATSKEVSSHVYMKQSNAF